ncbi:hypothetical protein Moror_1738 [Moniliophthora roreri MCA 2997]|uniref:Uncharacterized protein n=1 Tax=Moniliophthora roreri (strain MCA 2997) TaxID=1381753 RepID=V2XIA7_MONRO|nr:hypothetical protein Moror_1738 [Moniliophthora roreri MCA 2997]
MDPTDNKMMKIGRMLEEARRPGGKIPRRNRFPLYVRMAHWDDGQGMPETIYEDPRTFKPEPGPNGEIHTWDLFPMSKTRSLKLYAHRPRNAQYLHSDEDNSKSTLPNRRELNCNIPDIDGMAYMQQKMRLQFSYNDNEPSPEDQFVNVLIERKRHHLSSLDLKDLPKRDVILKINLYGVRNPKDQHRI